MSTSTATTPDLKQLSGEEQNRRRTWLSMFTQHANTLVSKDKHKADAEPHTPRFGSSLWNEMNFYLSGESSSSSGVFTFPSSLHPY